MICGVDAQFGARIDQRPVARGTPVTVKFDLASAGFAGQVATGCRHERAADPSILLIRLLFRLARYCAKVGEYVMPK